MDFKSMPRDHLCKIAKHVALENCYATGFQVLMPDGYRGPDDVSVDFVVKDPDTDVHTLVDVKTWVFPDMPSGEPSLTDVVVARKALGHYLSRHIQVREAVAITIHVVFGMPEPMMEPSVYRWAPVSSMGIVREAEPAPRDAFAPANNEVAPDPLHVELKSSKRRRNPVGFTCDEPRVTADGEDGDHASA